MPIYSFGSSCSNQYYLNQTLNEHLGTCWWFWHPTPVLLPGKSHGRRSLGATVHGVSKSQTRLSSFTFTFHFHALEKEMATHSCSCLENPRDEGAWWAAFYGVAQSWTRLKRLGMHVCIGEGNGNPPQSSCLENPRDWGAWWAAVCGVTRDWSTLAAAAGFSYIYIYLLYSTGNSSLSTL